jgi:polyphosphate kinase
LIVRGMCALRPGIKGISNNIRVRSIVGRFLEHSRIYYFGNNGADEIYLSSADWMPRNLYERVEVAFPVKEEFMRQRVKTEILGAYLADNVKARTLNSSRIYLKSEPGRKLSIGAATFSAQEFLIAVAEGRQTGADIPEVRAKRIRGSKAPKKQAALIKL